MEYVGEHELVHLEIQDGVAEIRLSDPDYLNCFGIELTDDLRKSCKEVESSIEDVSVLAITAAGRGFSSGADVDILQSDGDSQDELSENTEFIYEWLHNAPVPVIAGVRGFAVGAGANLISYGSDMRVFGTETEIWWPEVAFGIPSLERTVDLARQIGEAKALEVMLMGEEAKLSAEEALSLGFANRIAESEEVDETTREMARIIAGYDDGDGMMRSVLQSVHAYRRESSGASINHAGWRRQLRKEME